MLAHFVYITNYTVPSLFAMKLTKLLVSDVSEITRSVIYIFVVVLFVSDTVEPRLKRTSI